MTLVFGVKFLTLQFTRDGFRQSGDDFFCAGTKDLVLPTRLQNPQHARRSYGSLTWGATPPYPFGPQPTAFGFTCTVTLAARVDFSAQLEPTGSSTGIKTQAPPPPPHK